MKQTLVTTSEAAEYLGGLKTNTLEGWRIRGEGPNFYKCGRLVKYSIAELDAWLESRARSSTSQTHAVVAMS